MAPQRAGRDITKQMLRHRQMVLDQMLFKQKAEEKKMSMSKNIARLAVTAGLTAALSFGGVMAPVTMAFAEGDQGSIKINQVAKDNEDNTFKAYQIFNAKVIDAKDGSGKIASNVKWAVGDQAQKDIIKAIRESNDYARSQNKLPEVNSATGEDPTTAQNVADWLSSNVQQNTTASANGNKGTRVAPGDVLYSIAKAVIEDETAVGDSFKAGHSWRRPEANGDGYYLFVSDGLADPAKPNTGTSPIFAIVGGDPVVVTEKTSIPTINKEILNDRDENKQDGYTAQQGWSNVADSQVGQEVSYKLTGSIADNYATYDSYAYKFTDTLSQGLTYVDGSLEVYALNDGNYIKINQNSYTLVEPTEGNNVLTVNFDKENGLKSATAASADDTLNIGAETQIVVFYKAKLNSKASYEVPGNTNEVYLEYSNNPMAGDTGKSEIKVVTDHVFRLDVTKTDKGTGNVLMGEDLQAGFKVKVLEGDEGALDNKWLGKDGEIVDESQAYEFKTKLDSGKVYIPGLDAGTYQITETTTPSGYNTLAPFTIAVKATYNDDGSLKSLDVTSSDTEMVTSENTSDATIPVTVKNKKGSGLPLTGLNGVTFTWIAGGAVLCIGVAHLIRSRKQAEESEQE